MHGQGVFDLGHFAAKYTVLLADEQRCNAYLMDTGSPLPAPLHSSRMHESMMLPHYPQGSLTWYHTHSSFEKLHQ